MAKGDPNPVIYCDLTGADCDFATWKAIVDDPSKLNVDFDSFTTEDECQHEVSTSFHGIGGEVYKTMVSSTDASYDGFRCVKTNKTLAQAEHDRVVAAIQAGEEL